MKKSITFVFLISLGNATFSINSSSKPLAIGATYLSCLSKNRYSFIKNPYTIGTAATTLLLVTLYARHRYKQLQQPYTDHQKGYCDRCHEAQITPTYCSSCSKDHSFLYLFHYGCKRGYCDDCLRTLKTTNRSRCLYCNKKIPAAVAIQD